MSVLCAEDLQPSPDILGKPSAVQKIMPADKSDDRCSDDADDSDEKKPSVPLRFRQLPASFWQEPRPKSMFCQLGTPCSYSSSPIPPLYPHFVPSPAAAQTPASGIPCGNHVQGTTCALCSSGGSCPAESRTHPPRPVYPYWSYRQCPCHRADPPAATPQRFVHVDSAGTLMYMSQSGCHPVSPNLFPFVPSRIPDIFPQDLRFHSAAAGATSAASTASAAACDQQYNLLSRIYHYRRSARYHPLL